MTAFHDGNAEAFLRQFGVQPFGELASFEANMLDLAAPMPNEARNTKGIARSLAFLDDMRRHLAAADRLFMDETTAPVLDPGRRQTKKGFFWAIASDDRHRCLVRDYEARMDVSQAMIDIAMAGLLIRRLARP
jgi:hypothetical protein